MLRVQLVLCALVYVASLVRFVATSRGVADHFTALVGGPYLTSALFSQLRVIPAYALFGVTLGLVVWPLARTPRKPVVVGVSVVVALVATLAQLRSGGLYAKVPWLNLYTLARWHVLDAARWVLLALILFAVVAHLRALRAPVLLFSLVIGVPVERPVVVPTVDGRLNVLILATDSWRFDRVGVHGAARSDLTPNIDAFATSAIDVDGMQVSTASTLESWVTLLTGQFPPTHGIRSMYPTHEAVRAVEQSPLRLPALVRGAGYHTFVSSDWAGNCFDLVDLGFTRRDVASVQNFKALIDEATVRSHPLVTVFFSSLAPPVGDWLVPGRSGLASMDPSRLTGAVFEQIDASRARGQPFFGVLFGSATHLPYGARAPFNTKYVADGYDGPNRYQVDVSIHDLITTGFARELPQRDVQHIRDLYDGAVSDFDDTVGQVLRGLEARGLDKETIVVITTDHGEDLYDPGSTLGHGTNFFGGDQSTRVPFFIRIPGVRPGAKVAAVTRSADFAPTMLELLRLEAPAEMEGVSLMPLLRGEAADLALPAFAETCYLFFPKKQAMMGLTAAERDRVVDLAGAADTIDVDPEFNHNFVLRPKFRQAVIDAKDRMVRTKRWKLIEIPSRGEPVRRLYDMEADSQQTNDLAGRGQPEEQALAGLLERYWRGEAKSLRTGGGELTSR